MIETEQTRWSDGNHKYVFWKGLPFFPSLHHINPNLVEVNPARAHLDVSIGRDLWARKFVSCMARGGYKTWAVGARCYYWKIQMYVTEKR